MLDFFQLTDFLAHELDLLLQERTIFNQYLKVLFVDLQSFLQVLDDELIAKGGFLFLRNFNFAYVLHSSVLWLSMGRNTFLPHAGDPIFIEFERLLLDKSFVMLVLALLRLALRVLPAQSVQQITCVTQPVF